MPFCGESEQRGPLDVLTGFWQASELWASAVKEDHGCPLPRAGEVAGRAQNPNSQTQSQNPQSSETPTSLTA